MFPLLTGGTNADVLREPGVDLRLQRLGAVHKRLAGRHVQDAHEPHVPHKCGPQRSQRNRPDALRLRLGYRAVPYTEFNPQLPRDGREERTWPLHRRSEQGEVRLVSNDSCVVKSKQMKR